MPYLPHRFLWPALALLAASCRLVDQTSFDPALRARIDAPKPVPAAAAPMVTGPPPLLTIRFDHPTDYTDTLRLAAAQARARKPNVRFEVVTMVPDTGAPDDQIAAVSRYSGDARRVASELQEDGVDPGQIALGARMESGVKGHEVRVYVE